jgi:hypothetical protein
MLSDQGPGVVDYSVVRVAGEDFRNVWAHYEICNFDVGENVRFFLAKTGILGKKWALLAVETSNGRFSMGIAKVVLLYVALFMMWGLALLPVSCFVISPFVKGGGFNSPIPLISLALALAFLIKGISYSRVVFALSKF